MYPINPLELHLYPSISGHFHLKSNPDRTHCCTLRSIDQIKLKLPDKVLVLHPICLSTLIQQAFLFSCQGINVECYIWYMKNKIK